MRKALEWKLGTTADHARFTRERAEALTPEEGLRVLEELRRMRYDDPDSPPRLERVFVLSRTPSPAVRRHRRTRSGNAGRPRYTEALDVLVEPTAANARRLAAALREFGYAELADAAIEHFAQEERMATLGRAPVAIDILTSSAGLSFAEAWAGRTFRRIAGERIPFLGLAEYVKTKRAAGRPKDLLDIELLREAGRLATGARSPKRTSRPRAGTAPAAQPVPAKTAARKSRATAKAQPSKKTARPTKRPAR